MKRLSIDAAIRPGHDKPAAQRIIDVGADLIAFESDFLPLGRVGDACGFSGRTLENRMRLYTGELHGGCD